MKIIEVFSKKIEDTLNNAEDYINKANEYREDFPEASKALYNMSENEMSNITSLHSAVVNIINNYKKENGDPPESMMVIYKYLHQKHIDHGAKIKTMQTMYKEGW